MPFSRSKVVISFNDEVVKRKDKDADEKLRAIAQRCHDEFLPRPESSKILEVFHKKHQELEKFVTERFGLSPELIWTLIRYLLDTGTRESIDDKVLEVVEHPYNVSLWTQQMFYNSVAQEVNMDVTPIVEMIHIYIAPLIQYFETSIVGFNKVALLIRQPSPPFDYKPGEVRRLIKLAKEATSEVERMVMTWKKDQPPSPEEIEQTYQSYQKLQSLRVQAEIELRNHIIQAVSNACEKMQNDRIFSDEVETDIERMRQESHKGKKKR